MTNFKSSNKIFIDAMFADDGFGNLIVIPLRAYNWAVNQGLYDEMDVAFCVIDWGY